MHLLLTAVPPLTTANSQVLHCLEAVIHICKNNICQEVFLWLI